MNCKQCGSQLSEGDKFCKNCGATVNAQNEQSNVKQAMYNQQSNFNGYNSNPSLNYKNSTSNNRTIYILTGIIIFVVIIAVVLGLFAFGSKGNLNNRTSFNEEDFGNISTADDSSSSIDSTSGAQSSNVVQTSTSSNKVTLSKYTVTVPNNLIYEIDGSELYVSDSKESWIAQFFVQSDGSYSNLKRNISNIKGQMEKQGLVCTTAVEKRYGGVNFITMELGNKGEKAIGAVAEIDSTHFWAITIMNEDPSIVDYKILELIAPIVKSTTQASSSNKITTNININGLAELAK